MCKHGGGGSKPGQTEAYKGSLKNWMTGEVSKSVPFSSFTARKWPEKDSGDEDGWETTETVGRGENNWVLNVGKNELSMKVEFFSDAVITVAGKWDWTTRQRERKWMGLLVRC
jgi:hypothetical protein